jgi:hypothetical protein
MIIKKEKSMNYLNEGLEKVWLNSMMTNRTLTMIKINKRMKSKRLPQYYEAL